MARKALPGLFFVVLSLSSLCFAQKNELTISAGATFASGTTTSSFACPAVVLPCPTPVFGLNTSTAASYEGTYARRLADFRVGSLSIELPVLGIPSRNVHLEGAPFIRENHFSFFLTPSAKFQFLSGHKISPFVSAGGGFAYFGGSFRFVNRTTAAAQFGAGLDFKLPVSFLSFRTEVRDFYTGRPGVEQILGANDTPNAQHNVFTGGGLVIHF